MNRKIGLLTRIKINTLKNGGGSFNIYGNKKATNGYMCSILDVATIDISEFDFSVIDTIIEKNKDLLKRKNIYLGTWIEGGKIYIDISKNYKSRYYCLKFAKKLNQKAIFDLNNFTSIYL